MEKATKKRGKGGGVSHSHWGYIFTLPFFASYLIFSIIPLGTTFYYSFYEYFRSGLKIIGPNYVGLENFKNAIASGSELLKFTGNTAIMWIIGFIPQILIALVLALILTSLRLNIKGQAFFKTVIYMPNLIMASALSMLFFTLFSRVGPVNQILDNMGVIDEPINFIGVTVSIRLIIAAMNFLMWFGNTTILLMAGIMGIDNQYFEAAQIDGASGSQVFFKVTLPLLSPILVYTIITSLIGGIQMYDVPQIMSNGHGTPNNTTMTLVMFLNQNLTNNNFGASGVVSIFILLITIVLSGIVYAMLMKQYNSTKPPKKALKKGGNK